MSAMIIDGKELARRTRARLADDVADVAEKFGAAPGLGTVTPYAGLGVACEGARSWRAGTRWRVAPSARLSLDGAWREAAGYLGPEHSLMLRGDLNW